MEPTDAPSADGAKLMKITVEMSLKDAERIKQMLAEGKLKELGIVHMEIHPPEAPSSKDWAQIERGKRANRKKRSDSDLPDK